MNILLLEQVKQQILKEPHRYNQAVFICNTAHCIGGWAAILSGWDFAEHGDIQAYAQKVLELTDKQAENLFLDCPPQFNKIWISGFPAEAKAKLACERIDHFIATEGRE